VAKRRSYGQTLYRSRPRPNNVNVIMSMSILIYYSYHQLRQLRPLVKTPSRRRQDVGPGVYFVSPGLLQLDVLRHHRCSDEPAVVCSECGCTFDVGGSTLWPHNAGATGAALASGSASGGL